jgi:hypothetical protein
VTLVAGSKQVVHWTSETWWESCEIAGSPQLSPPAATPSVVKPEGRPAASVKPGQESCVRSSGTVTLLARGPSDSCWGRSPVDDQSRRGHQCSETTLTGESRFHISTPRGFEPVTLVAGSKQDQWDMVRIMWDCRLSTILPLFSPLDTWAIAGYANFCWFKHCLEILLSAGNYCELLHNRTLCTLSIKEWTIFSAFCNNCFFTQYWCKKRFLNSFLNVQRKKFPSFLVIEYTWNEVHTHFAVVLKIPGSKVPQ